MCFQVLKKLCSNVGLIIPPDVCKTDEQLVSLLCKDSMMDILQMVGLIHQFCTLWHWTFSVQTFLSECQKTPDPLHKKPHQFWNYDPYNGKDPSHTSDKPLEAGWRKMTLKQATHPLKGKWPRVRNLARWNTGTTMQRDRWNWAAGKESRKRGVYCSYA